MRKFAELSRNEQIAMMTAWLDGAVIQFGICTKDTAGSEDVILRWTDQANPSWCATSHYRIKPILPSIDWSHVHQVYKWMATDSDGTTNLFAECPVQAARVWNAPRHYVPDAPSELSRLAREHFYPPSIMVYGFASFKPGTCDWDKSLVERPQGV